MFACELGTNKIETFSCITRGAGINSNWKSIETKELMVNISEQRFKNFVEGKVQEEYEKSVMMLN